MGCTVLSADPAYLAATSTDNRRKIDTKSSHRHQGRYERGKENVSPQVAAFERQATAFVQGGWNKFGALATN